MDMIYYAVDHCTYHNPKLGHVRVDVAKLGLGLHMSALRGTFVKRTGVGTCKTKDSDAQVST